MVATDERVADERLVAELRARQGGDGPAAGQQPEKLCFASFTLDVAGHTLVAAAGQEVPLTRSEFALLVALTRVAGRALSRDHLLAGVTGRRAEPFDRNIDVLVGRLRRKIEADPRTPRLIVTVPGVGYKFAARLEPAADPAGLEPVARPRGWPRVVERRLLTVMRCGLAGADRLAATLDPEELHRLVAAYHARCAVAISRFGGVIAHYESDGVLAYFGYPVAHEHDAERAIRAGLAVGAAAAEIDAGLPTSLDARVGIATGAVIIGDLFGEDSDEHAALGQAPELAARLAATGGAGAVVVAAATRRLVGGLFDCRALGANDDEAFQVVGEGAAETRFDALHAGDLTPFVGRDEEIGLLLRRWQRARAGAGRVVHVIGEPGLGKSRLVVELRARLAEEAPRSIGLSCSPLGMDIAFHPFIDQLARAAGFDHADTAATRLDKLRAALGGSPEPEAVALLAEMLSIETEGHLPPLALSPGQRRERTAAALINQIVAPVEQGPVLLVVEDAHWLDPSSRDVLDSLLERVRDLPVLTIVTSRPEFAANWPATVSVETQVLHRLDQDETALLITAAGGDGLAAKLHRWIIASADGVPLHIEELTRTLVEGAGDASSPVLPASLQSSLMARLDRLPAAKEVAHIAAVIGRSFDDDLIATVSRLAPNELARGLADLVTSGLVARRGLPPDATYTFKHVLVQIAAHDSLPRGRQAELHARIVDALRAREPDIDDAQPALVAHHCEHARRFDQAVELCIRAGWRSFNLGAYTEGRELFSRALRLVGTLPDGAARAEFELRATIGLGSVTKFVVGFGASEYGHIAGREAELCERLANPLDFVSALWDHWLFLLYRSDLEAALALARRLVRSGEERQHAQARIVGHYCVGATQAMRGEFAAARSHLAHAIELYDSSAADQKIVWDPERAVLPWVPWSHANAFIGLIACWTGYPVQARAYTSAAIRRCEGSLGGHAGNAAGLYLMQLRILATLLDAAELARPVDAFVRLTHGLGIVHYDATAAILKGYVVAQTGDPCAGSVAIREGLAAYAATGAVWWSPFLRALLAETHQMMGDPDEALRNLTEALDQAERIGERWYLAELHRRIGEVHRQRVDDRRATACLEQALAIARGQGARLWELQAATSIARLLRDRDRHDEAYALLAPIHGWFSEGFDTVPLRQARDVLTSLRR